MVGWYMTVNVVEAAKSVATSSRELEKPFWVSHLQVGDSFTIPMSPVTLLIVFGSAVYLWWGFHKSSTAMASHILMDDEKELKRIQQQVGQDQKKFAAAAEQYSTCPSGKQAGGNLGQFKQGSMAPPFDQAVFSRHTQVGTVVGPIQTSFGWHLIFLHERDEQRQLVIN
jgi:peptidyl-prolyl cis-trans isomerase C